MNRVFFPGMFRLDRFGSSKIIALNALRSLRSEIGERGCTISPGGPLRGRDEGCTSHVCLDDFRTIRHFLTSKLARTLNKLGTHSPALATIGKRLPYREKSEVDRRTATLLEGLLESNDILIGFMGDTLACGRTTLLRGARFIVHSQFCHPEYQSQKIIQAYTQAGLRPLLPPEWWRERQIESLRIADRIWCPSELVRRTLQQAGIADTKLFRSYIGIPENTIGQSCNSKQSNGERFQILYIGTVSLQKGIWVLLNSILEAGMTDIRLVLNGWVDSSSNLLIRRMRGALRNLRVELVIDPGDPSRYFKGSNVFVLPSLHDAFGICVLEAMAAGLPVIVSDGAGAHEVVQHEHSGLVVEAGNTEQLAQALLYYYQHPLEAVSAGQAGLEISKKFTLAERARAFSEILSESKMNHPTPKYCQTNS